MDFVAEAIVVLRDSEGSSYALPVEILNDYRLTAGAARTADQALEAEVTGYALRHTGTDVPPPPAPLVFFGLRPAPGRGLASVLFEDRGVPPPGVFADAPGGGC